MPRPAAEQIVPEKSFLRRLPVCLEPTQRLRFAAFVFASDILSDSLRRLYEMAVRFGEDAPNRASWEHAAMISCCWTVIDQLHLIRQVLGVVPRRITEIFNFIDKYEAAKKMRNALDHINQQVDNLSKATQPRPAVFGGLTYVLYNPKDRKVVDTVNKVRVTVVSINGGPILRYPQTALLSVVGAGSKLELPASHFGFAVGDQKIEFDAIEDDLRRAGQALADDLEITLVAQIRAEAEARGLSLEKLMEPGTANVQIAAQIEYDTE